MLENLPQIKGVHKKTFYNLQTHSQALTFFTQNSP